jgi:tRNA modification GTPase
VAQRYLSRADLVLFCLEAGRVPDREEESFLEGRGVDAVMVAYTKVDLAPGGEWEEVGVGLPPGIPFVEVSSETGAGLRALVEGLRDRVYGALTLARVREVPVVTRERQVDSLKLAREEVGAFAAGLRSGLPPEVVSSHLHTAETALEEVVGVIHGDEVLDVVFREFCIGK